MRDMRHCKVSVIHTAVQPRSKQVASAALRFACLKINEEDKQRLTRSTVDSNPVQSVIEQIQKSCMVVRALDDVALVRRLMTRLLTSMPGNIEFKVTGATDAEIESFVHDVMSTSPSVDVVILDNVLSSPTHSAPTVYGLDLADELRTRGFGGVIVISSANDLVHAHVNMPKDAAFSCKQALLRGVLRTTQEIRTGYN